MVAEEFEIARYAASLVRVEYETDTHTTKLDLVRSEAYEPPKKRFGINPPPRPRGDSAGAFDEAPIRLRNEYRIAIEHHNPMEMHASTVVWEGDGKLTVYDKTQGSQNSQNYVVQRLRSSPRRRARAVAFCRRRLRVGPAPAISSLPRRDRGARPERSVRVVLTRDQMFTFGYRPDTIQTVALGANPDGVLHAMIHEAVAGPPDSRTIRRTSSTGRASSISCDNVRLSYKLAQIDLYAVRYARAWRATGVFALESAMDELAYATAVDPLELRLRNYAEKDENEDKPFSSKELRACYELGAERFGWAKRKPEPRSMRDGRS